MEYWRDMSPVCTLMYIDTTRPPHAFNRCFVRAGYNGIFTGARQIAHGLPRRRPSDERPAQKL
jgi:hypothetical protein